MLLPPTQVPVFSYSASRATLLYATNFALLLLATALDDVAVKGAVQLQLGRVLTVAGVTGFSVLFARKGEGHLWRSFQVRRQRAG